MTKKERGGGGGVRRGTIAGAANTEHTSSCSPPLTPFVGALLLTFPLCLVECVQAEQESVLVSAVAVWTCHSSLWKLNQAGGRSRLDTV